MFKIVTRASLITSLLGLGACAQMCAADQVAMAVARLTTLNADAAISLLDDDTTCGFESQAVKDAVERDGENGSQGTMTWRVSDCELDLGDGFDMEKSCFDGSYKTVSGKIVVKSATRTVAGMLMSSEENPILPTSDSAVTIEIQDAVFTDFRAQESDSDVSMTWVEGSISGKVYPRLAKNNTLGACSVLTSHRGFSDVIYTPSSVIVHTGDQGDIEVEVGASDLHGQVGQNKGRAEDGFEENHLEGFIEIWGTRHDVPVPGDEDGLDPDYDEAKFYEADECLEDILVPVSFDCG